MLTDWYMIRLKSTIQRHEIARCMNNIMICQVVYVITDVKYCQLACDTIGPIMSSTKDILIVNGMSLIGRYSNWWRIGLKRFEYNNLRWWWRNTFQPSVDRMYVICVGFPTNLQSLRRNHYFDCLLQCICWTSHAHDYTYPCLPHVDHLPESSSYWSTNNVLQ